MRSQGQNYTHDIIRQRAPVEPGNIEISGGVEFIGQQQRRANPSEYLVCIFGWIRRRIGESRHFFCKVADWLGKERNIIRRRRSIVSLRFILQSRI